MTGLEPALFDVTGRGFTKLSYIFVFSKKRLRKIKTITHLGGVIVLIRESVFYLIPRTL